MNENERDEYTTIKIVVGRDTNALTIANGIVQFVMEMRLGVEPFVVHEVDEARAYEDIREIGEALLGAYKTYERVRTVARKQGR